MGVKMYNYRIYPSKKQKSRLFNSFKTCKIIYNELLALNIDSYKFGKVSLVKFDFNRYLTGKYLNIHSQVKQNVSDRVSKSFQDFFTRVKKNDKKKGFPRFKSRVNSITFPQSGFKFLSDKKLKVSKVGNIPIVLHRVLKGKVKTLTIKINNANQWFVIFCCEMENGGENHIFPQNSEVGIDVGLESFATLSNGSVIGNPRFLVKSEKRLKLLQRRLSKKKEGSKNRLKAKLRVARQYNNVVNQRTDFLHKLSNELTKSHSVIAVEDLKIKNMVKNRWLAKSISDASWGSFVQMLSYKAVTRGGQLVKVNPRNTSKICSCCGTKMKIPLSKRVFECSSCGFVCHRDLNASFNIYDRAGLVRISTPVDDCVRLSLEKAAVNETGTNFNKS